MYANIALSGISLTSSCSFALHSCSKDKIKETIILEYNFVYVPSHKEM